MLPNNNPDIVIIEGGRNDYSKNVPIGDNTSTDTKTFKGALNTLIDGIQARYPNALILATTVWETGTKKNSLGNVCSDYGDALIEICTRQDVPVWNAMDREATGVDMTDTDFKTNYCLGGASDVSHLNQFGMMKVMPVFEKWIAEQYSKFSK